MKLSYVIKKKKKIGEFEVHYIWYQRKSYNTGPEQGHINCLVYIMIYEKLINLVDYKHKDFMFCVE